MTCKKDLEAGSLSSKDIAQPTNEALLCYYSYKGARKIWIVMFFSCLFCLKFLNLKFPEGIFKQMLTESWSVLAGFSVVAICLGIFFWSSLELFYIHGILESQNADSSLAKTKMATFIVSLELISAIGVLAFLLQFVI